MALSELYSRINVSDRGDHPTFNFDATQAKNKPHISEHPFHTSNSKQNDLNPLGMCTAEETGVYVCVALLCVADTERCTHLNIIPALYDFSLDSVSPKPAHFPYGSSC